MQETETLARIDAPTSRSALVEEALKRAILEGQLSPGTPLVERDLAAKLDVSKTPVREALISLSRSGLVEVTSNRRMSVVSIGADTVKSITEMRLLLEPHAAAAGVPFWTPDDIAEARQLLLESAQAGEAGDWSRLSLLNRTFHRRTYSKYPNKLLCATLDNLQDRVALVTVESWRERPTWRAEGEEHTRILDAIEAGDREAVERLSREHVSAFSDLVAKLEREESA